VTEPYAPPEPTGYEQEAPVVTSPSYVQLTQQRVRLGRAAEAFATPDEAGRYPIVVLVKSGGRFQVQVLLVAGAVAQTEGIGPEAERVLGILVAELPVKQAAALAARITGLRKADLYRRAVEMKGGAEAPPD